MTPKSGKMVTCPEVSGPFTGAATGKERQYGNRRVVIIMRYKVLVTLFIVLLFAPNAAVQSDTSRRINKPLKKGVFLVADPHMKGPYFQNSVVLLLKFGTDGAMGVIINRPTNIALEDVMPKDKGLDKINGKMFLGGPVAGSYPLMLLKTDKKPDEMAHHIFDNIYYVAEHKAMDKVIKKMASRDAVRIYAGHAGWYPGQLEAEVKRGGWLVISADPFTVFDKNPKNIWEDIISGAAGLEVKISGNGWKEAALKVTLP